MKFIGDERRLMNEMQNVLRKEDSILLKHLSQDNCILENAKMEKMLLQEMQRTIRKLDRILNYFLNSYIISEEKKNRIIENLLSREIVDYFISGNKTKKVIYYEEDNGRAESDTSFTQILPVSTEEDNGRAESDTSFTQILPVLTEEDNGRAESDTSFTQILPVSTEEDNGRAESDTSFTQTLPVSTECTKLKKIFLESNSLEKLISRLLIEIGIPANIGGYTYSREALLLMLQYNIKVQVTKYVYPDVAKKCKVTSSSVERCIRHAIERAWENGNLEVQNEIFGYTVKAKKGKPTNSEFLFQIADYISLNV